MNEDIRKAIEELEVLACDLERQATAWHKDLPGVAVKLRALAAHMAARDQPEGTHRSLPGTAASWMERGWHVVPHVPDDEPSMERQAAASEGAPAQAGPWRWPSPARELGDIGGTHGHPSTGA
jgi:hypothetical protein